MKTHLLKLNLLAPVMIVTFLIMSGDFRPEVFNRYNNDLKELKKKDQINVINSESKNSHLFLRFLDSETGYAIVPTRIEFRHHTKEDLNFHIDKDRIASNGTLGQSLENGIYDIAVFADGYKEMRTYFELIDQELNVNFNLVALSPRQEYDVNRINYLHQEESVTVLGFIVDDMSGQPIPGVQIKSHNNNLLGKTNAAGYFQFQLLLPHESERNVVVDKLFFEKDNYITEIRQNFDMYPNGDLILQLRMQLGTGINELPVQVNRGSTVTYRN